MKTDNPWMEAILAHSIRHAHPFWENDPERSLKEVVGSIHKRDFEDWESATVDDLQNCLRSTEEDAARSERQVEKLCEACGTDDFQDALLKIRQWNPTQTTPSST